MVAGIGPVGVAYLLTVASSNMRFNFAFQKWKQVAVVICMMDCVFVGQVSDTARTGTEEPTAANPKPKETLNHKRLEAQGSD